MSYNVSKRLAEMLARHEYDTTPPERRFPDGYRWLYWTVEKKGRYRRWFCAYSTTKNANGKFVSYVVVWESRKGGHGEVRKFREHAKREDAKARAYRMYQARKVEVA